MQDLKDFCSELHEECLSIEDRAARGLKNPASKKRVRELGVLAARVRDGLLMMMDDEVVNFIITQNKPKIAPFTDEDDKDKRQLEAQDKWGATLHVCELAHAVALHGAQLRSATRSDAVKVDLLNAVRDDLFVVLGVNVPTPAMEKNAA